MIVFEWNPSTALLLLRPHDFCRLTFAPLAYGWQPFAHHRSPNPFASQRADSWRDASDVRRSLVFPGFPFPAPTSRAPAVYGHTSVHKHDLNRFDRHSTPKVFLEH